MLHLDHASSLSSPLISHSDLPWSAVSRDNVHKDKPKQPQSHTSSPTESLPPEEPVDPPQAPHPDEGQTAGLVNNASRQSTPLSELSSPTERSGSLGLADTPENSEQTGVDPTAQESGWQTKESREKLEEQAKGQSVAVGGVSEEHNLAKDVQDRQTMEQATALPPGHSAANFIPSQLSRSTSSPRPSSRPPSVSYLSQSIDPIPRRQSTESVSSASFPIVGTPTATSPVNTAEQKLDTKVVTILELNAELLKIGMEFQARGVSINDPRFAEFAKRMQSNLTWMATVADSDRGGLAISLPIMHAPPTVEFASMERIYQLYSTLPTIFANDIARRQTAMARRSQSPSVSLKRDRADEHSSDIVSKRRDTGEHKLSSLPTSPSNHPPNSFATPSAASTPQPITPSVSMGPPPNLPPNADPRRQMTAMRPQMQPQQNPQSMAQPNNHNPAAVQPTNPSANPLPANVPPQVAAMGVLAVQYYQMLQNPSHPLIHYIMNSFPGFQSLPVNQQIMKVHQVQTAISKNKAQAGQRTPQPNPGGQGNLATASQFRNPTGMPAQTQGLQQPGISFPQGFNNGMANPNVQNMVPSQQTALPTVPNLNVMAANQRQLLMMHQMRAGASGNTVNPPLMNAQTVPSPDRIRQDQSRMSSGSPSPQLSMGVGLDTNSFPMMRSNSTVPGIARSTRSPTDPGFQGRVVSNNQEEMQRAFVAQQQRNMMASQGNAGFVNPHQILAGGNSGNWQQQISGGMGVMGQQPQQPQQSQSPTQTQNFGVLPTHQPTNFGSPMIPQQHWNATGGPMQYPFPTAPSPGGTMPQQQQISSQSTMMDPSVMGDFDFSSWTNQM